LTDDERIRLATTNRAIPALSLIAIFVGTVTLEGMEEAHSVLLGTAQSNLRAGELLGHPQALLSAPDFPFRQAFQVDPVARVDPRRFRYADL
jgi:hypothetical protein